MQAYNPYLDFLIDPNLLRVSRFFALTIENEQKKKKNWTHRILSSRNRSKSL